MMKTLLVFLLSTFCSVNSFTARGYCYRNQCLISSWRQATENDDDELIPIVSSNPEPLPIEDDLLSPSVIMRRESLLFSENPSSQNIVQDVWEWCGAYLPAIVTGDTTQAQPCAGLYNMLLVRVPTLLAGIVYVKNLALGHPLIVDMGNGPFVVNPVIVGAVLWAILRT